MGRPSIATSEVLSRVVSLNLQTEPSRLSRSRPRPQPPLSAPKTNLPSSITMRSTTAMRMFRQTPRMMRPVPVSACDDMASAGCDHS